MRFCAWMQVCVLVAVCVGAGGQQLQQRPQLQTREDAAASMPQLAEGKEAPKLANANVIYRALQQWIPNGRSFAVENVVLQRDAARIVLKHGTVFLSGPVNGRVVGAAFLGEGVLHMDAPNVGERKQLHNVLKVDVLDQPFTQAAFMFNDGTAKELEAHTGGAGAGNPMEPVADMKKVLDEEMGVDLSLHMLEGVLGAEGKGRTFAAMIKGSLLSKRMFLFIDPEGVPMIAPDQVELMTSSFGEGYDMPLGFRLHDAEGSAMGDAFRVPAQTIETVIEKNGHMPASKAAMRVVAMRDGVQVLRLHPTLRAGGAWDSKGRSLDFMQGPKDRGEEFGVVLAEPLKKGESIEVTTSYSGKDVVIDEGNDNYYPTARESWYPNVSGAGFGNYAQYRMIFHVPADIEVVATGNRLSVSKEKKTWTTVWQSNVPMAAAGFSLGRFKSKQGPDNLPVQMMAYANEDVPSRYSQSSRLETTGMLPVVLSQAVAAMQTYTLYFGKLDYNHIAVTQQAPCSYGQSWPMLVYLPMCAFWDDTIKHMMGRMDWSDPQYFKTVTAHEVSHQWWGHTVGFGSYRDQWMSEGFAMFSAGVYLLETNKDMGPYRDYWKDVHRRLTEKNEMGVRPVDVGAVTMGLRTNTSKTGNVYNMLVYPKGAYILHMLEMMFWTPQYGEKPFQQALQAFVNEYRNKVATTEDFKRVMEANMPQWVDIDHNRKLDWFFNEYVYGTEMPKYAFEGKPVQNADGTTSVQMKLTQSNVSASFEMRCRCMRTCRTSRLSVWVQCRCTEATR